MQPLIEVQDLIKEFSVRASGTFGKRQSLRAIDGVSYSIYPNEVLALVGESGCGKSTTGLASLRLIEPTSGSILFDGDDLQSLEADQLRKSRSKFQMVFQNPRSQLNPRMRIIDSVAEPLRAFDFASKTDIRSRALEALELVGLDLSFADRYPHQLSGGQRQRVGISRAIATNPSLVVLDEAVSALDVSVQTQVMNLLLDLQENFGLSYLFISHSMSSVKYLADRVMVMYLGRVVESAPAEEFFKSPAHPYSKALLSAVPVPRVGVKREQIALSGDVPSPFNVPSGCVFRTRCPIAQDICISEIPLIQSIGKGRTVACHFPQI